MQEASGISGLPDKIFDNSLTIGNQIKLNFTKKMGMQNENKTDKKY
jgi:hypothetical protein